MDTHSQFNLIISQIKECYGKVAYSHKTHEKAAEICFKNVQYIKVSQITLSGILSGSLLFSIFGESKYALILSSLLSLILFILNTYTKENNLIENGLKFKRTANRLWLIREKYLSLLTDSIGNLVALETIRKTRDSLQNELSAIYNESPPTTDKAYRKAQKALKYNEELYFSQEELNMLLPERLRKQ